MIFPGKQSREESDNDALNSVDDEDDEEQGNYGVSAYGMSAASGTNASGSKRGLPKLREILRRQKQDSEDEDTPGKRYYKIYFRDWWLLGKSIAKTSKFCFLIRKYYYKVDSGLLLT